MSKILRDILTCKDNMTYDQIKILGLIGFIVYNMLAILDVIKSGGFEYLDYATGVGILFAAIGGSLWAKRSTEPGQ
jgi:hypothetical protein